MKICIFVAIKSIKIVNEVHLVNSNLEVHVFLIKLLHDNYTSQRPCGHGFGELATEEFGLLSYFKAKPKLTKNKAKAQKI